MQWLVELVGYDRALLQLSNVFDFDECAIVETQDRYFMTSSEFSSEQDPYAVLTIARSKLVCVNALGRLAGELHSALSCGDAFKLSRSGALEQVRVAPVLYAVNIRQKTAEASRVLNSRMARALLDACSQDQPVKWAVCLWANCEHDWFTLYKVYEILEQAGKTEAAIEAGKYTRSQFNLLKRTACSAQAVGVEAARHAKQHPPPKNPMSLSDAENVIASLLRDWLLERLRTR